MRKTAMTALIATTVLLSACGGDDDSTDDATTTAEQSGGEVTTTTEIVDGPSADADHGIYVAGNSDSTEFDLDALTTAALEKLRAATG